MTRAKKLLILIGNPNIIEFMTQNADSKKRNTAEKEMIHIKCVFAWYPPPVTRNGINPIKYGIQAYLIPHNADSRIKQKIPTKLEISNSNPYMYAFSRSAGII